MYASPDEVVCDRGDGKEGMETMSTNERIDRNKMVIWLSNPTNDEFLFYSVWGHDSSVLELLLGLDPTAMNNLSSWGNTFCCTFGVFQPSDDDDVGLDEDRGVIIIVIMIIIRSSNRNSYS